MGILKLKVLRGGKGKMDLNRQSYPFRRISPLSYIRAVNDTSNESSPLNLSCSEGLPSINSYDYKVHSNTSLMKSHHLKF